MPSCPDPSASVRDLAFTGASSLRLSLAALCLILVGLALVLPRRRSARSVTLMAVVAVASLFGAAAAGASPLRSETKNCASVASMPSSGPTDQPTSTSSPQAAGEAGGASGQAAVVPGAGATTGAAGSTTTTPAQPAGAGEGTEIFGSSDPTTIALVPATTTTTPTTTTTVAPTTTTTIAPVPETTTTVAPTTTTSTTTTTVAPTTTVATTTTTPTPTPTTTTSTTTTTVAPTTTTTVAPTPTTSTTTTTVAPTTTTSTTTTTTTTIAPLRGTIDGTYLRSGAFWNVTDAPGTYSTNPAIYSTNPGATWDLPTRVDDSGPVVGAIITLTNAGPDDTFGTSDDVVTTTTTATNGTYHFDVAGGSGLFRISTVLPVSRAFYAPYSWPGCSGGWGVTAWGWQLPVVPVPGVINTARFNVGDALVHQDFTASDSAPQWDQCD